MGSEFVGMFVGLGAHFRIKSLFKKARQLAAVEGGCIDFLSITKSSSFAGPRVVDQGGGGGYLE